MKRGILESVWGWLSQHRCWGPQIEADHCWSGAVRLVKMRCVACGSVGGWEFNIEANADAWEDPKCKKCTEIEEYRRGWDIGVGK